MTRLLSIVALLALAAVAPLFAAQAIGSLESHASNDGACLAGAPAPAAPKVAPTPQPAVCVAGDTADDGPEVRP